MSFEAPYEFGERVFLDGDKSLVARVVAFSFRTAFPQIEIAWVHNGGHQSVWVDSWRLAPAEVL